MDAFFLGLALLLLAVVFVVAWRALRRRPRSVYSLHERPVPLARIWNEWLAVDADDEHARRQELFARVSATHRDAVREDLLRFEKHALSAPEPLLAIRNELMDSIDRRMINREILALPEHIKRNLRAQSGDVITSDAEAEAYLAANELRLEILREYAGRRFGDRAPRDWFDVYEHASMLKQRTARNYITRSLSGELDDEHDARHQAISLVDSQLRAHLLKVAPGTSFEQLAARAPE